MSRRSVFPAEERGEGFDAHAQAGGRGDLLAVHGVEQGRLAGQCGHRRRRVFRFEKGRTWNQNQISRLICNMPFKW